jgi:hypothetical protein
MKQVNNGIALVKGFIIFRLISKAHHNSKPIHKHFEIIRKGKDISIYPIKAYRGLEVELQALLTSLETHEWSASTPAALHTVGYTVPWN